MYYAVLSVYQYFLLVRHVSGEYIKDTQTILLYVQLQTILLYVQLQTILLYVQLQTILLYVQLQTFKVITAIEESTELWKFPKRREGDVKLPYRESFLPQMYFRQKKLRSLILNSGYIFMGLLVIKYICIWPN